MTPLVILALAVAAPVPKPAKKLEELYGEIADPMSDVKCDLTKDGALRVSVPKTTTGAAANRSPSAAPVTTKRVEGDFVLTVRVTHPVPKSAERVEGGKRAPAVSAGVSLYVEGDRKTDLTVAHEHINHGTEWTSGWLAVYHHRQGGGSAGSLGTRLDEKPVYIRLTRRGDLITADTSADGEKWTRFDKHLADKLGSALVVGPVVYQNTTADFEAVFDRYEIKPLKAEKK